MCLIYLAWRRHPRYPLVVAANRDEYHARPAAPAHWWEDAPGVLAGRDLEAGGTWMGVTRGGRFAAVTNYHDPAAGRRAGAPSRGALVGAFLTGGEPAPEYLDRVVEEGRRYNGFCLLAMDGETLAFASNRSPGAMRLDPGVYGLSNHLLDTPWPKVTEGKAELETAPCRTRRARRGAARTPRGTGPRGRRRALRRHRKRPRAHAVALVTVHPGPRLRNAGVHRRPARSGRRRCLRRAELRFARHRGRRRRVRVRRRPRLA